MLLPSSPSFPCSYGQDPPPIGYTFNSSGSSCTMQPQPLGSSNSLSPLAAAELLRRIVLYDVVQPERRVPGVTRDDVRSILCVCAQPLPPVPFVAVAVLPTLCICSRRSNT